jgi:hypothetical protein
MQSSSSNSHNNITVFCDKDNPFDRKLMALVKRWDRRGSIQIMPCDRSGFDHPTFLKAKQSSLLAVDENGVQWNGAEAVPIIFKNLPFGKLAAAIYILPGTMWLTKQLCGPSPTSN